MARLRPVTWFLEKQLERRLREAVREALGVPLTTFTPLPSAHCFLFRVETNNGAVLARIPLYREHNEQAVQTAAVLEGSGIPHPKLLAARPADGAFAYGVLVHEWVEGTPGSDLIRSGHITERELFVRIGRLVRRLHDHPVPSFGAEFWLPGRRGFRESEPVPRLPRPLKELRASGRSEARVLDDAIAIAGWLLAQVMDAGEPVLVHGDLHADNVLLADGRLVLIDWLNAHGGCRAGEFAKTRWIQSVAARDAMREGYGADDRFDTQAQVVEEYHSVRTQLRLVEHYARVGQEAECRRRLSELEAEVTRWRASGRVEIPEPRA